MKTPDVGQSGTESSGVPQLQEAPFAARVLAFCRIHRLLVLFLGAFAVRVAFILASGPTAPPWDRGDDQSYDKIAYRLVSQHEYANTLYTPGYPLFLALNYAVFGRSWPLARLVQAGLGAATCLLVYRLGTKMFSERVGLIAGILLAVYPGHAFFAWRIMPEPLYILLLTWCLLLALSLAADPQPFRAFGVGIVVGVTQLVARPVCRHMDRGFGFGRTHPTDCQLNVARPSGTPVAREWGVWLVGGQQPLICWVQ
jgi:hypothetical protein